MAAPPDSYATLAPRATLHVLVSGAVTASAEGITLRVVDAAGYELLIRMTDDQATRVQTALGTVLARRTPTPEGGN